MHEVIDARGGHAMHRLEFPRGFHPSYTISERRCDQRIPTPR